MAISKLTPGIITAAISGFEQQKIQIDIQIAELRAMLSGTSTGNSASPDGAPPRTDGKRRKMSAAARKRIAEAQKARWAKTRGEAEATTPATRAVKRKRRISEEGMKRIIAATKKRWAAVRVAQAKSSPTKKATPARKSAAGKKSPTKKAVVPLAPSEAAR